MDRLEEIWEDEGLSWIKDSQWEENGSIVRERVWAKDYIFIPKEVV